MFDCLFLIFCTINKHNLRWCQLGNDHQLLLTPTYFFFLFGTENGDSRLKNTPWQHVITEILGKNLLKVWFFVFQVRGESNNRGMSIGCDTDVSAEHIWGDNSGELSGSLYFRLFSLVGNKKKHCKYFSQYAVWYGDIKVIFQA